MPESTEPTLSPDYEKFLIELGQAISEAYANHDIAIPELISGLSQVLIDALLQSTTDNSDEFMNELERESSKLSDYIISAIEIYREKHPLSLGHVVAGLVMSLDSVAYTLQTAVKEEENKLG